MTKYSRSFTGLHDTMRDPFRWRPDPWWMIWGKRAGIAALLTLLVIGAKSCYDAGVEARDNDPPRIVSERTTEWQSYSCGKNCVSGSRHYILISTDGATCDVEKEQWATAEKGRPFKCTQLFGWRE